MRPGVVICGSRYADVLRSRLGHTIFAFAGNDVIYARNRRADEIWAGRGRDRAYVDRIDIVRNVERVLYRSPG